MLELMPRPLPFLDPDAVAVLTEATQKLSVRILTNVRVEQVERKTGRLLVRYTQGGKHGSISADCVANGAGRVPDLEHLDLDAAGIERNDSRPDLDEFLRSRSNPDVFFAGDANPGAPQLSPVATYEGQIVGHNLTPRRCARRTTGRSRASSLRFLRSRAWGSRRSAPGGTAMTSTRS